MTKPFENIDKIFILYCRSSHVLLDDPLLKEMSSGVSAYVTPSVNEQH